MKKTIFIILITIAATLVAGYGLYILYDIIMTDATLRLKQAIAEGIQEGITSTINPLNWAQFIRGQ
jgi:hypothetical protein